MTRNDTHRRATIVPMTRGDTVCHGSHFSVLGICFIEASVI